MSTVIKAGETGKLLKRLSAVDLADHLAEARAVVDGARRQASDLIARTQREVDRLVPEARKASQEQGYAAGYEKGFREGREAGVTAGHREAFESSTRRFDEEQRAILADMKRVIEQIDAAKEELAVAARRHLLDFAVGLGTKLTFAIGLLHREAAIANLNRALDLVASRTDLTVRVHPDDAVALERFAESALRELQGSKTLKFVVDPSIAPGGCTVGNEQTEVDATLETQVGEIVSLLLGSEPRTKGVGPAEPAEDSSV